MINTKLRNRSITNRLISIIIFVTICALPANCCSQFQDTDTDTTEHTTTPPSTTAEDDSDLLALLTKLLNVLVDKDNSHMERINTANSLEILFAPDAIVRILDDNGAIIRERPAEFLGRTATSRLVKDVVPIEVKTLRSGYRRQITTLVVTEKIQNL